MLWVKEYKIKLREGARRILIEQNHFFANTHPQLLVSHSAEMFPSFICTHSSKRCYVLLLTMIISECIVNSIHTVRNKWERESSPSQCEQQVLGRRGRVSQGRMSGEDGVGSSLPPFQALQSLPFYNG